MLAFDFGGTKLDVALVEAGQLVVGRSTLDTVAAAGAEQAVKRALAAGHELMRRHGVPAAASIGVSTMGYTRTDGVDLAPNVPGWESLHLPAIFAAAFSGVPCVIDNDVRAAATAEAAWGALVGVDPGVYVNLGTGVAATLLVGGQIVGGHHGVAGEIGYWLVPAPSHRSGSDPAAPSSLPLLSTLEEVVGGAGVRRQADLSFAELLTSEAPGSRQMAGIVMEQIAVSLANLSIMLDPERIVLGGGYTWAGERLLDPLRAGLRRSVPFPPEIVIGRFGSDVGLYGAIALAERALL